MTEEKKEYTKADLWKMKKEDLLPLLDKYEVDYDEVSLDRKAAIEQFMIAQMMAGDAITPLEVSDEGEVAELKQKKGTEYVDIIFHDDEHGDKYVFLGQHGNFLYLPREYPCRIPADFMDVIKDTVIRKLVQTKRYDGKLINSWIRVPRLHYEILDRGVM